ncbi:hypothetical protein SETIT_6G134600v2 [Setaria italica]|uniref:Uncharacterized protein n=1 Tax=Setaria italica TaxID=4555 RepID=A0A368RLA3_SETIT|nr:hypothetical protein SETIT_6G134600v2 [Setaria italica]
MQALQALDQKAEDNDCRQEDKFKFKFLQRNVRKLFGMCSNMTKNKAKETTTIPCASSPGSVISAFTSVFSLYSIWLPRGGRRFERGGGDCRSYEFLDLVWSSRIM